MKESPTGQRLWWYIVKTNEFPYAYWTGERWGSSFRAYAAKYATKEKAEKFAFEIVANNPALVGIVDVIERD